MDEPYEISTAKLIEIVAKEIGKEVPGLKAIIGTQTAVFAAIEKKRVDSVLRDILKRVSNLEDLARYPKRTAALM